MRKLIFANPNIGIEISQSSLTNAEAGWPSGLRRCVQVAVSPGGAGSNPASVTVARLAQSVERWTLNPTVVGSSPTLGAY